VQKREEMEKRRKEAARPRALENRLWKLVTLSVYGYHGYHGYHRRRKSSQEIEDEKAEICQELASLGWTMEAKLAEFCKRHWQAV
jgi:hypothetical protein